MATEFLDDNQSEEAQKFKMAWEKLICDIHNLSSWVEFVKTAEEGTSVENKRYAYSEFLKRYPCFVEYWKKHAQMEIAEGQGVESAKIVCEKAVNACKVSVDLWMFYINLRKNCTASTPNEISKLYRRALDECGLHFYSDNLWLSYLEWEKEKGNGDQFMGIYEQYLSIPTKCSIDKFPKFQECIKQLSVTFLCTPEEYIIHSKTVDEKLNLDKKRRLCLSESEKEQIIKDSVIKILVQKHKEGDAKALLASHKRVSFENKLTCHKFFDKDVPIEETSVWMEYADYEITENDSNRVEVLFERALMVFPNQEVLWLKYIYYMEKVSVEKTRNIYARACWTHLLTSYSLNMDWAVFEEANGCPETAETVLYHLDQNFFGQAYIRMRLVNLCRRNNRHSKAIEFLQSYVEMAENNDEKLFYLFKHVDFLTSVLNDKLTARKVLSTALNVLPSHESILLRWLQLEECYPVNGDDVYNLLKTLHNIPSVSEKFKLRFTQRVIDILEQFGSLKNLVNSYSLYNMTFDNVHSTNISRIDLPKCDAIGKRRSPSMTESEDRDGGENKISDDYQHQHKRRHHPDSKSQKDQFFPVTTTATSN